MKKAKQGVKAGSKEGRRTYRRPELKRLGQVREMTAGGSRRANEDNKGTQDFKKVRP